MPRESRADLSPDEHHVLRLGTFDEAQSTQVARLHLWSSTLFHPTNRFTMIESFCPPNPKLFERATSTFILRAWLGT